MRCPVSGGQGSPVPLRSLPPSSTGPRLRPKEALTANLSVLRPLPLPSPLLEVGGPFQGPPTRAREKKPRERRAKGREKSDLSKFERGSMHHGALGIITPDPSSHATTPLEDMSLGQAGQARYEELPGNFLTWATRTTFSFGCKGVGSSGGLPT